MRIGLFLIACVGCSSSQTKLPEHQSWAQHLTNADRHEQQAVEHDRAAAALEGAPGPERFECGDPVLNDQLTTGGLRVTTWQPCFDLSDEAAERNREVAMHERELAKRDREAAARQADAERISCTGVPVRELHHSAFAHTKSIDTTTPVYADGRLAGVRVVFKAVRGLNADWVRRDIDCQRARWAVFGKDPKWMPTDPTLVEGAKVEVSDRDGHVEVVVTTRTTEQAEIALARARGQLGDNTAKR